MEWTSTIQKAITYIEEHLMEPINYEAVARYVNFSSYEFHRTFSFLTGMTVNTYIRNRRLSLAGIEIIESNAKITDISLKYGYETPESFTKAFTRFHGVAPRYVRENSSKLVLFNPLVIKILIEGGKSMDYRIVQTKKQKFITIIKNFRNEIINDEDNHDIPDFWQECQDSKIIDKLINLKPIGQRNLYGLCSPSIAGEATFKYGIGILVGGEELPISLEELENSGFSIWDVNAGTYAVFDCIGEDADCISDTWSKFFKEFLPQTGYSLEETTDYEVYLENSSKELFCELWIPIKKDN